MSLLGTHPSTVAAPAADQAAEYASAWRTFLALDRAAPHSRDWARWANGRGPHLLLLARVTDPGAVAAVRLAQQALAGVEGVELHPISFLHVSIQSLGFQARPGLAPEPGEVAPDELPCAIERLGRVLARLTPFPVALGAPNAFHSSVLLETHSGGHLLALRRALRSAEPLARRVDPHEGFLFHLTLGYFEECVRLDAVRAALRPLRSRPPTLFTVDALDLVALPTDQRVAYPPLEPIAHLPLGG